MSRALDGLLVLEFSAILGGPYCGGFLADQGAQVIRVEPLTGSLGRQGGWRYATDRNKQSIAVDLRTERGHEIMCSLLEQADVLIQNFRPGAMDRLGFSYANVSSFNPRIVYCSLSGYGDRGPWREKAGQDLSIQAVSGLMRIVGYDDRLSVPAGTAPADAAAGMLSALGIMLALYERERSGLGQEVKTSLLMSLLATMPYELSEFFANGESGRRVGSGHYLNGMVYGGYRTKDGEIVMQGAPARVAEVLGNDEMARDERFVAPQGATRAELEPLREEVRAGLQSVLSQMTTDEALDRLDAGGVWCMPVMDFEEITDHPQLAENEMVAAIDVPDGGSLRTLAAPMQLSRTPATGYRYPPDLGEHTAEVLSARLGLDAAEIARLRQEQVIA
ncbi:MAG TPA: CoA transferase [Dehalococcoidia bacterium]|nr:CoA transferase [Dehalococcoidia bacterium]